jgi:hypothetical protein
MLTNLPPSCAVVLKSGKVNFLENSGLLQACNGTALILLLLLLLLLKLLWRICEKTLRVNLKYWEKILFQCNFFTPIFHVDWKGIEIKPRHGNTTFNVHYIYYVYDLGRHRERSFLLVSKTD